MGFRWILGLCIEESGIWCFKTLVPVSVSILIVKGMQFAYRLKIVAFESYFLSSNLGLLLLTTNWWIVFKK